MTNVLDKMTEAEQKVATDRAEASAPPTLPKSDNIMKIELSKFNTVKTLTPDEATICPNCGHKSAMPVMTQQELKDENNAHDSTLIPLRRMTRTRPRSASRKYSLPLSSPRAPPPAYLGSEPTTRAASKNILGIG